MNSTHKCEVIRLELQKHPNADSLSFMSVFGGYTVCCKTEDWKGQDKAIYIPPESLVEINRPEFNFLAPLSKNGKTVVVKAKKFRGMQSFGLLVPAPKDAVIGEDYAERLGVTHYEPEFDVKMGGDGEKPPTELASMSKYDVDTARKYSYVFTEGEEVIGTLKLHGSNSTYSWVDGRIWVKSRSQWLKETDNLPWWIAYYNTPSIRRFCEENPYYRLHGEVLGVQGKDYSYNYSPSKTGFAAFDISDALGQFLDFDEYFGLCVKYDIPMAPIIYRGPWLGVDKMAEFSEGKYVYNNFEHIREGVVYVPKEERWHPDIGRVKLKIVGFGYLEKK